MSSRLKSFFRKKQQTSFFYWLTAFLIGGLTGAICTIAPVSWVLPIASTVLLLSWWAIREQSNYALSHIVKLPKSVRFVGKVARAITSVLILLKDDQKTYQWDDQTVDQKMDERFNLYYQPQVGFFEPTQADPFMPQEERQAGVSTALQRLK